MRKPTSYIRAGFAKGIEYLNQDDWFLAPADSAPLARTAALKALTLQETDSEAHVVLGIENHWYESDCSAAEREFRRAVELKLNPNYWFDYYFLARARKAADVLTTRNRLEYAVIRHRRYSGR